MDAIRENLITILERPRRQNIAPSPSLSERYPWLKSVVVDLEFFDASGVNLLSFMQYKPNLTQAISVFPFGGRSADESLSELEATRKVSEAIHARRSHVSGEWPHRRGVEGSGNFSVDPLSEVNLLRFKLTLGY